MADQKDHNTSNSDDKCPKCDLTCDPDHQCISALSKLVRSLQITVNESDELLSSQNLLIAKLIAESENFKEQFKVFETVRAELSKLRTEFDEYRDGHNSLNNSIEQSPGLSNGHNDSLLVHTRKIWPSSDVKVSKKHELLIRGLKEEGLIVSNQVFDVMMSVDFRDFDKGGEYLSRSWQANKVRFFERYATIAKQGSKVLYMFSNAYVAVCLALLVGPSGLVVSEGDNSAVDNIRKHFGHLLDSGRLVLVDGRWCDFFRKGHSQLAPYDVVIVGRQYYTLSIEQQLSPNGVAYDPWHDKPLNQIS